MRSTRGFRAGLALVVAVSASGCSWLFMSRPPPRAAARGQSAQCTTGRAAPLLDTLCSGYFVVNTVALAAAPTCSDSPFASNDKNCVDSSTRGGGIALSLGLATLCGVSAASGFGYARNCESMRGDWTPARRNALDDGWRPEPYDPPASRRGPAPPSDAAQDTVQ